jgi:hypothetical protein
LGSRPRRRSFAAKDKLRILEEVDRAARVAGAIMHRPGDALSGCRDRINGSVPMKMDPSLGAIG